MNKKLKFIILISGIFLYPGVLSFNSFCQEQSGFTEEWVSAMPDSRCRVYVEESPGEQLVYFISELGMEFKYLKKNLNFKTDSFHEVYFNQPGIVQSTCNDTSKIKATKLVEQLQKIHKLIDKKDSFSIACHGQGCHIALLFYKKNPRQVASIHMIQPKIQKPQGKYYLNKTTTLKPYMKNINKGYGSVFFPDAHQNLIQSLPQSQKIPKDKTYLYLSSSVMNRLELKPFKGARKLKNSGQGINFLNNDAFSNNLRKDLINDE
jgi:pimeloyl-ACP methyl ester carboxylesterase